MKLFNLYNLVCLKEDISTPPLNRGMVGTIIYIYKPDRLFEVDFISKGGDSLASVVLESNQLLKLEEDKIPLINEITTFQVKL